MISFLGLGSNLGARKSNIEEAIKRIDRLPATAIIARSTSYETKPVGYLEQPDFLNSAVKIETELKPEELLEKLLDIENIMGRKRAIRWGPRKIDIDILFYDDREIVLPHLQIPHKELHKRRFVLDPLLEIEPDLRHPVFNKTIKQLKEELC